MKEIKKTYAFRKIVFLKNILNINILIFYTK